MITTHKYVHTVGILSRTTGTQILYHRKLGKRTHLQLLWSAPPPSDVLCTMVVWHYGNIIVCVCVCFLPIHSGHQVRCGYHIYPFARRTDYKTDTAAVVDSHIQRIVLATEETTVTQQVSHRPIKYQSRLWSQRGTKFNRLHNGDNPLLRPTGIQIATKSYSTLQAMAPTNIKTVHETSFTPCREQPRSTWIVLRKI